MKRACFVLIFCILSACSDGVSTVHDAVRSTLKDPESARFSDDPIQYQGERGTLTCGQVNAKNSFGGYVGDRWYIHYQDHVAISASEEQNSLVFLCCMHVVEAAEAGKSAWDQPGFTTACSGMPGSGFDFTKRI